MLRFICSSPSSLADRAQGALVLVALASGLAVPAAAQPVIGPFSSTGATAGFIDDVVFLGSTDFDLLSYSKFDSGSGHLSDPFGAMYDFAYQDCESSVSFDATVAGPVSPFISTSAASQGTQGGIIVSTTLCTGTGTGSLIWDFGFYSATLASFPFLPIAFNIYGETSSTGSCAGIGYCSPYSEARLEITEITGSSFASAYATDTGPTLDIMNVDLVGDMDGTWKVFASAASNEGGAANVIGGSGSGASVADVNGIQLIVDFALTETLMKIANPALPQATIDAGLADLELHVSPGLDVTAFAPQFPVPEPARAAMLQAGGLALLFLRRLRRRRR